jgi:D-arabinose 1-dehydrogenase-like Zn-dependent alcohol dehydrogenase
MRAAIFEKHGLENLKVIDDAQEPKISDRDVLIKVKATGINPIDYRAVYGGVEVKPLPHIPGAEISGVIERIGNHVKNIKEGDRAIVYNKVFDGTCDMCISQSEMVCRNGGIIGVLPNQRLRKHGKHSHRNRKHVLMATWNNPI